MSKSGKILIAVMAVVLLAMAGGVFAFLHTMDDATGIKIEAEEIPCGLEWGMTESEARAVLDSAGYMEQELENMENVVLYWIPAYQGNFEAKCGMFLYFSEEGKLHTVHCRFAEEATEIRTITREMLEELQIAFEKAYEKECEEVFIDPDPLMFHKYCLMEKSLVSFNSHGGFGVQFEDREYDYLPEYIEYMRNGFRE